jgi:hypothetical protein
MISKKIFLLSCLALISTLLLSCAGQIPPGGGPADTVPPQIIFTQPDSNAVNVRTDRIVIEFSEYVDRRSVEESIFLSPYLGELEFDWSGTELTVTFSEELKKNTTYVMNVGTDVVDVRARNRMADGFTLAFSTGDMIDQGKISGRVFDDTPEGIMMFAYALGGINSDTLDPSHTKPDYIMQTGKYGSFTFSNIRLDTYRIFAVRDEYRNLIYDKQTDRFGVTTRDIMIDEKSPQASDIWFRLSSEDTTKPFLTRVVALSRMHLSLRFSEALDSSSFGRADIRVEDTLSHEFATILLQSLERSDSMLATVLMATTLDSGKGYRLFVEKVLDRVGNAIDPANSSYAFEGVGTPDTMKPRIEFIGMRDSTKGIPLEQSFELRFSEPVKHKPLHSSIMLLDSAGNKLAGNFRWLTASSLLLTPEQILNTKSWYTIRVIMDSVQDYFGNRYRDSMRVTRFQSLDLKTTGTIDGFVADTDTGTSLGEIFLTATQVTSGSAEKTLRLPRPGKFKFEQLPEGQYTLRAFRDRDSSKTYSYGKPFPFQHSERFAVYRDTVKVRARWGVEGVGVSFKADSKR